MKCSFAESPKLLNQGYRLEVICSDEECQSASFKLFEGIPQACEEEGAREDAFGQGNVAAYGEGVRVVVGEGSGHHSPLVAVGQDLRHLGVLSLPNVAAKEGGYLLPLIESYHEIKPWSANL